MENQRFRTWETAALIALCLTLLWGCWAQGRQNDIAAGLVRLHVLAVSDDAAEQALKMRVRDAVLDYLRPRLAEAEDAGAAREILREELPGVAAAAQTARPTPAASTAKEHSIFRLMSPSHVGG